MTAVTMTAKCGLMCRESDVCIHPRKNISSTKAGMRAIVIMFVMSRAGVPILISLSVASSLRRWFSRISASIVCIVPGRCIERFISESRLTAGIDAMMIINRYAQSARGTLTRWRFLAVEPPAQMV